MSVKPKNVVVGQRWRLESTGGRPLDVDVIAVKTSGGYNLATVRCGTAITVISVEGLLAGGVYLGPA